MSANDDDYMAKWLGRGDGKNAKAPLLEGSTVLTEALLDDLPYGVIVVDKTGTIVSFNRSESEGTGISRERVMGRNFFTEVAPCTQVGTFSGRFEKFVTSNERAIEPFEFVFPFLSGAQRVTILFSRDNARPNHIAIFVFRAETVR